MIICTTNSSGRNMGVISFESKEKMPREAFYRGKISDITFLFDHKRVLQYQLCKTLTNACLYVR